MKIEIDEIYEIIRVVDCDDAQDSHSEEWRKGYNEAVAQIRLRVLEIAKTHVAEEEA